MVPYEPTPGEALPDAKRVAARAVEQLTTYAPGDEPDLIARRVSDDEEVARRLVVEAAPMWIAGRRSTGRVIYPQLGGSTADAASVMVVVQQTIEEDGGASQVVTRTLDVRLRLRDGVWALDRLASAGGTQVPRPDELSPEAARVLDDPRITLPDSARWDIHAGAVEPALLRLMAELAGRTPYAVVTLSRGHPFHVFGTDRQSNHTKGRAVDIYRLGERRVIDDRSEGSATFAAVQWLYDRDEVTEVGSPWALDGFGGRSFTDVVHADHLHVGVRPDGTGPAAP